MREIGFSRGAPKWTGPRPDMLTVGGSSLTDGNKWTKLKRTYNEIEVRKLMARVIETAVIVCMSTHVYSFSQNLYIQCTGGPIGVRFTASLANVVMKQWDKAWVKLL